MNAPALLCARCEYDLRTLDHAGLCPECAMPIAESVAAAADPLHGVRRGLRVAAGVLVAATCLRVGFAVALIVHLLAWGQDSRYLPAWVAEFLHPWPLMSVLHIVSIMGRASGWTLVLSAWFAVGFVAQCAGIYLITGGVALPETSTLLRRTARWVLIVLLALGVATAFAATRNLMGVLAYTVGTTAAGLAPSLAIALWTGHLWSRTRAACDRARPSVVAWAPTVAAIAATLSLQDWPFALSPWLVTLMVASPLLVLGCMWFDLWRLAAPRRGAPIARHGAAVQR